MGFSLAYVTATETLSPRLRRVHFEVADLDRLALPGLPDEALGLYFPEIGQRCVPHMGKRDDVWGYFDTPDPPPGRNYTLRHVDHDAATMVVDFVVHAHGPATTWAQRAEVGDGVGCAHARGWYRPPAGTDWILLVTDLAGLPATARIIDEFDADPKVSLTVIAEVAVAADLDYLPTPSVGARVRYLPLIGSGNGLAPSGLDAAVTDWPAPAGNGYCWFAGEATPSRAVRTHLRREHHWQPAQYDVLGYWRRNGEEWSRRYARHGADLLAVYQRALDAGKGEKQAAEEFDEALEQAGL